MKPKQLLSCFILLLAVKFAQSQFSTNSFAAKVNFSAGINTQGLVLTDLNLDGKKDIVVTNTSTSNIYVYLNSSSIGTINSSSCATGINLTALSSLSLIYSGDFDGDNKNDILVGYTGNSNFSIFRNNYTSGTFSASSFSSRQDFATASSTTNIGGIIDIDLDGKMDVVIGSYTANTISVFRNISSGVGNISFAGGVTYATGSGTNPTSLILKDINGDNKPELFVSCFNSAIRVYQNTSTSGSVSFSFYTAYTAGTGANFVRLQDIDNDGRPDIECSSYYTGNISIFKNTTVGGVISFNSTPIDFSVTPSSNYGSGIDVGDLDYDSKPDICGVGVVSANLAVFKNISTSGTISTGSFASKVDFSTGSSPNEVRIADFDGDLRPDIINTNYNSGTFSIFKNRIVSSEPTISASNIIAIPSINSVTLNFNKGNGERRLVVARTTANSMVSPIDTSYYFANTIFGNGSNIGSNNYIVYSDTGASVTITGLSYGQVYSFTVYEYNGIGGFSNFLTSSAVAITQTMGDVYYSKSTGILNLVNTWGSNTDGTGTAPSSFNNPNTVYKVVNNPAPTLSANWIVSGTNSFIEIGDGINALNFTIPSGTSLFTDSVSVKANATLTFIGGLIGNKAYFDSLSTAQFTSSNSQNIPGFTYYNIVIANSVKTITNNCNVRGALNLLNNINTGAYTLTLGVSGTQPGVLNRNANGTITGRFKRWFAAATNTGSSGLFPMLVGSNYRPASVEFTVAPTNAGTLTTEFFSIPPGNSGLYLYDFSLGFVEVNKAATNGYWKIDPIGTTGGIYTLTLTGTGFYGISAVTDLRIIKRQTAGAWTLPSGSTAIAGTGATTAPVVGRSGYSGFGEFTLGGDSTQNPMPVKWLSFEGTRKEEGVLLNWKTAQEINNAYFIIERKTDNKSDFEAISKEFPINTGSIKSYTYFDQNISKSETYIYRIKQVDLDGKFSYSKTLLINFEFDSEEIIVGPNPANDNIMVRNININEPIELIDALGKIISVKLENDKIKLNNIPSGVYQLNVTSLNGQKKSIRIIKE